MYDCKYVAVAHWNLMTCWIELNWKKISYFELINFVIQVKTISVLFFFMLPLLYYFFYVILCLHFIPPSIIRCKLFYVFQLNISFLLYQIILTYLLIPYSGKKIKSLSWEMIQQFDTVVTIERVLSVIHNYI